MNGTRKELTSFFLIAFGWMWLLNLPRVLASMGLITIPALLSTILGYTAVFAPAAAAFILTAKQAGKAGAGELWRNGWRINFPKKWLLPAILLMPAAGGLTVLILRLLDLEIAWEYALPPAMIVPIGLLIWLVGAYPEEYGWRGYALPRLLKNNSPLTASLILGVIWALWHLPLHFIDGTTQSAIPVWEYLVQTVVLAVLYTWLHLGTGGSVFIAALFHAFGNLTGASLPYWTTTTGRWISFLLLLVPAALAAIKMQRKVSPEASDA